MKPDNKSAWIGVGGAIIVALIAGVFSLIQKSTQPSTEQA